MAEKHVAKLVSDSAEAVGIRVWWGRPSASVEQTCTQGIGTRVVEGKSAVIEPVLGGIPAHRGQSLRSGVEAVIHQIVPACRVPAIHDGRTGLGCATKRRGAQRIVNASPLRPRRRRGKGQGQQERKNQNLSAHDYIALRG